MVQALKSGELDYAHNVNADQFKQLQADPAYTAVEGASNGWTQLAFNTYGTGTGKTIPGGGPSTKALLDPKFRDALGYAVDKQQLVERVLGGFGDVGTTNVPPVLSDWHVEPTTVRTFDIELAKQKLTDAGYPLNADGKRLDKENKPIALRVIYPNTHDIYAKSAQFVQEWYGELGIDVSLQSLDSDTLTEPRAAAGGRPARQGRIRHRALGLGRAARTRTACCRSSSAARSAVSSDSQYCNPTYDALYDKQSSRGRRRAQGHARRDAEHHLRRRAVRHPVLRLQPRRLSERQVRGLAEHAERRTARRSSPTARSTTPC